MAVPEARAGRSLTLAVNLDNPTAPPDQLLKRYVWAHTLCENARCFLHSFVSRGPILRSMIEFFVMTPERPPGGSIVCTDEKRRNITLVVLVERGVLGYVLPMSGVVEASSTSLTRCSVAVFDFRSLYRYLSSIKLRSR